MASTSSSELRRYLDKAEDKLLTWTDKLEKAEALLERSLEKGIEELIEKARERMATAEERITAAKKDIHQIEQDLDMLRAGTAATVAAPISGGMCIILAYRTLHSYCGWFLEGLPILG